MSILISTPQQLSNIRNNMSGVYELANDIDMSSFGNFVPIGTITNASTKFSGTFDGKGYKISNLSISASTRNVGLFGFISNNSIIKNVAIENANVTSNMQNYVGILVGYMEGSALVTNCYTSGTVNGQYGVGGLVGWHVGGLIENCYSYASVYGLGRTGGVLGNGGNTTSLINKCYAYGLVTDTGTTAFVGGVVGSHTFGDKVTNCYYDNQTTGQSDSLLGTGLTTTQSKTQSSYVGWDFTDIWGISGDYPFLQVFGVPDVPAKVETITVNSSLNSISSSTTKQIKKTIELTSILTPIFTNTIRNKTVNRNVEGYLSQINSNVEKSIRSVKNTTKNVTSHINPINVMVERQSKTIKHLLTYIKPLQGHVSVLYPLDNKMYRVTISVLENPSNASHSDNMSLSFFIKNPTISEVIA